MSTSIKIKTEKAFAAYLETVLALGDFTIYEGHNPPDDAVMALPALVIYAESAAHNSELPPEMGIKDVQLRARFYVDSEDTARDDFDALKDAIEAEMRSLDLIKAALNAPAGADLRTYKGIHFHDVIPSAEPSDREGTKWSEEMAWVIIAEPQAIPD